MCSWTFHPTNTSNSIINMIFASFIGLFLTLWLIHLFEKIKVCKNLKETNEDDLNDKKSQIDASSEFFKKSKIYPLTIESPYPFSPPLTNKEVTTTKLKDIKNLDPEDQTLKNWEFSSPASNDDSTKTTCKIKKKIEKAASKPPSLKNYEENICVKIKNFPKKIYAFLFFPKNATVFLKRYEILHREYKSNKNIFHFYAFVFYMKQCFMSFIVVVLYESPIKQIIIINLLNLSFIAYTIFSNPFVKRLSFIICLVNEIIVEIAFFAGMIIAFLDFNQEEDINKRMICCLSLIHI